MHLPKPQSQVIEVQTTVVHIYLRDKTPFHPQPRTNALQNIENLCISTNFVNLEGCKTPKRFKTSISFINRLITEISSSPRIFTQISSTLFMRALYTPAVTCRIYLAQLLPTMLRGVFLCLEAHTTCGMPVTYHLSNRCPGNTGYLVSAGMLL